MDENIVNKEDNILQNKAPEKADTDSLVEKDDIIDVLHVYPSNNDSKDSFLRNIDVKEFTPSLTSYNRKRLWSFFRSSVINMFLPFLNGVFLGFGEIFAHEVASRWGFLTPRV
ncbi:uncharacterized protein T551_00127 [Pneumocystis jirovecii RU7]|uniref:Mitochondrial import protein 1 n=1 Tax=Pneumocystis jirovecii (strain RU7) TaxID=1408657 RepID=A0A0W4ZW84_PNEJ7|nr:uncharacterized protein T551_00127 [Pneumocystis jirovecii RU7]KTW32642.1 hypothetical protein T551_00127 [Pneumocystis jirovecii RU7]